MKRTAKGALTPPEKVKHTKPPAATGFRCSHKVAQPSEPWRAQSVKAISFLPARETHPSSRGGKPACQKGLRSKHRQPVREAGSAAKPANDESVEGIFSEKERLRELKHLHQAEARRGPWNRKTPGFKASAGR